MTGIKNTEKKRNQSQAIRYESPGNSAQQNQIADVYTTDNFIRCFLIQTYYTPFFTKIQAFCKKTDGFVDYDKFYVNIVMLTQSI